MSFISPPSTLPPGAQIWAYLRDSGGEGQDRSVERQEAEIKAYCHGYGLKPMRWFRDVAKSGGTVAGRDAFGEMISAVEHGEMPDGILIWNYARFARNLEEATYYKALIRRAGVVVHSLTDPIPEGTWDRAIETIIDISNEEKRRQTSRDVKSELRRLVSEYGAVPGTPPRGFVRAPLPPALNPRTGQHRHLHRWDPDPDLAPVILRAFQLRARGASLAQIHQETGGLYAKNSWTTCFRNKLYKGVLEYGDLVIQDYCQPIVPPELWEAANLVGRQRARPQAKSIHNPRRVNSNYLLTGLACCQECGQPMIGNTIKNWMYYVCSRRKKFGRCSSRRVPASALETGVIEALIENVLTLENMLALQLRMKDHYRAAHDINQTERRALDRQLAAAKKEIRNLTNAIKKRGHSLALLDALDQAELQKAEIEIKLAALQEALIPPPEYPPVKMADLAEQITHDLRGNDDHKKRLLLRAIVSRVVAKRTDSEILAVIYYIPPQNAITPGDGGDGVLGLRGSAPTESSAVDLIAIQIPVKRHKAPVR